MLAGSNMNAAARSATVGTIVRKVLASAIPALPSIQEARPGRMRYLFRWGGLPPQPERIFQWGRLEISIGLHRRQCRRSPGSVQLRSSRDDHAIRDRVANRFVSLPRTTQGVGPLEAPSRDTTIDGGWRRFHARQGKRMQRMHVFLLRSPPGRPGAGSRKSADQQPTLHEWIAGGWAEIALLPAARPPVCRRRRREPAFVYPFFWGITQKG